MDSMIVRIYDRAILKKLSEDVKFLEYFGPGPKLTIEELRQRDIKDRWYNRRISRVKRFMASYHVSGSEVCDCDY